jgi:tRNA A58 N-methylase Trm61
MDCERVYTIAIGLTSAGPGDTVADLGAGHGLFSRKLLERVGPTGRVVATDIARDAFDSLQQLQKTMPQLSAVLVSNPNDTGLGAVADASLAAAWMMNSIVFDVEGTKANDVAWLRTLYSKLRPGGEVVYHLDWVDPQLHDLQQVADRFHTAGFSAQYKLVDLPAEMPVETCVCVSRLFPVEAKKGFIAIFKRPP